MDLEEWEFLPNNGFLEIHDNNENKNIIFGNFPSQSRIPNQLVPVQIQLDPSVKILQEDDEVTKEVITENTKEDEQDQVTQVFFKKETEFENMKLESPKFNNKNSVSQIDTKSLKFEDKDEENMETESNIEENHSGLNLWNWSLIGIGAICSVGVAATICIFIGNHQKKKKQNKLNQKLNFQFSDDKKMNQVVHQQPTKLNEARKLTVEGLLSSSLEHIQDCLSVS